MTKFKCQTKSNKESEKEDVIGRGGQSHEGSGDGGEGITEKDDPLSFFENGRKTILRRASKKSKHFQRFPQ
jgi:hypothetical protein